MRHNIFFAFLTGILFLHRAYGLDPYATLPLPLDSLQQKPGGEESLNLFGINGETLPKPPDRSGMKTTGIIMTSVSYGLALLVDIILNFSDNPMDERVARVLWIPLAGPIAADVADQWDNPASTIVCLGWSITETVGVILTVTGAVKEKREKKLYNLRVAPTALPGGKPGIVVSLEMPVYR